MKTVIVYFSRAGHTRKVANALAERLDADTVEITEPKKRNGMLGFIKSGRESMSNKIPEINPITADISEYELLVLAAPIWAGNLSTPARAFLIKHKDQINEAAFCITMNGNDPEKALATMGELSGKTPIATVAIRAENIDDDSYIPDVEAYVAKLNF
ncbi:MAG: flavodoxin domain-containing protein [Candidatus Bathyarchaeota archaeon]|nr:flavodoxin domain-containing protein [Candidatus Bathyarchaeota archaeon]